MIAGNDDDRKLHCHRSGGSPRDHAEYALLDDRSAHGVAKSGNQRGQDQEWVSANPSQ